MHTMDDWELLQDYAKHRSETAFAELVQRHLNWVYSAAWRQVRDPHLAKDVTQAVFVLLARKAGHLRRGTIVSGWLFRTTRFVAARALRTESRRRAREQTAFAMSSTISSDDNEILWNQLTPHLDEAVGMLSETDRTAILLRFYEKKSLREVGDRVGLSEEAAKKRVTRAVEKLRASMTRRGVVLGGAGLIAVLAENTVQAAPATLASGIVKAAATSLSATATLPQLARETLNAWRWAHVKLAAVIAVVSVAAVALTTTFATRQEPTATTAEPIADANQTPAPIGPVIRPTNNTASAIAETVSNHVINVFVVEAQTKLPLAGVEIEVRQKTQTFTGRTDERGHYPVVLAANELSWPRITARREGFVPMTVWWQAQDETVPLPQEFTFTFKPAVPIGGVIQNEQGQPIPGATVSISVTTPGSAENVHGVVQTVRPAVSNEKVVTDAAGRWQYNNAPADVSQLYFRLEHPVYVSDPTFSNQGIPSPEKLHDMTSVMVMKKGLTVAGTVLDTEGHPIPNATVLQGHDRWGTNYPETTTDAAGHFQFADVASGELVLTIQAEGYAPELETIDVNAHTEPLEVRLGKGNTTRLRVVDTAGNPIAGAWVNADTWHGHRSLKWESKTDSDGRCVWTSAPPDAVQFTIGKAGFLSRRNLDHLPSYAPAAEQVVTLQAAIHIHGAVVDADTGQAIAKFKITPGVVIEKVPEPVWQRWQAITFTEGRYELPLENDNGADLLRVEAEGYISTNSAVIPPQPGDVLVEFRLKKGTSPSGIIRGPDGQPATNADVILVTGPAYVRDSHPMRGLMESMATRTEADGSFKLVLPDKPFLLVVTDDRGFAEIHSDAASFPIDITLQPWGRVEGTFFIGSKLIAGQAITIQPDRQLPFGQHPSIQYLNDKVLTDDNGHFVVEHVHPGDVVIEPSYTPLVIKSGETTSITLGGTGRPVSGRILPPPGATNKLNIANLSGSLELKQSSGMQASFFHVAAQEKLTPEGAQIPANQWSESDAGKAYLQVRRIYRITVSPNGSFRVNEVPAGTYNFHVDYFEMRTLDSQGRNKMFTLTARLATEVIVPEIPDGHSDEPLDLGSFELKSVLKR